MAEYWLTPKAEADLEAVWVYTAKNYGAVKAHEYVDAFHTAATRFSNQPLQALCCAHIRVGYRRFLVGKHQAYFTVKAEGIVIVRVLHQYMDVSKHL